MACVYARAVRGGAKQVLNKTSDHAQVHVFIPFNQDTGIDNCEIMIQRYECKNVCNG